MMIFSGVKLYHLGNGATIREIKEKVTNNFIASCLELLTNGFRLWICTPSIGLTDGLV
jgi:hypothetical protein